MTSAKQDSGSGREAVKVGVLTMVAVIVIIVLAYQFVGPPPPKQLLMATGTAGGAYQEFGERYAEILQRSEVELELLQTAGALQNIEELRAGRADIALVQGGTSPDDVGDFAKGLASVYYEPLWIFLRAGLELTQLSELRGARVEVGAEGSGTRAVALDMLALNGIDADSASLLGSSASDAAEAVLAGEVEAAFFVTGTQSQLVGRLMSEEGVSVRLFDIERHLAYERTYSYLAHVVLAEGVLDFERNIPNREIDMVAPAAFLLARADLHQALTPLFLSAAEEVHGDGSTLVAPHVFPSPKKLDAPLAAAADEYFRNGPSFLYRVFPFPVAATLDRLKIMLLPLLTLLIPLFRVAPPLLRWRIRRKVFKWYKILERIEREFELDPTEKADRIHELVEVEREVINTVDVPASYMEELHNLRMHVARVRERIAGQPNQV